MAMVKNSLTKLVKEEGNQTFSNYLMKEGIKKKINETVGGSNGQRFITSILSAVSTNPTLQECEHGSIISAAFLGEALKLSPSPQLGQYYMVPFNDNKRGIKVAQFQLGYKGYIQLALRSGYYRDIDVYEVREGEYLGRDKTTGKYKFEFMEDDDERENKPIVGYMAYFEYLNGFTKTLYWSKEKMLRHADKYSQAFSVNATTGKYPKVSFADYEAGKVPASEMWKYSSFWYKDFNGMAYKTMLRQLISKWGIMSIDMQEAYTKDMATIKEDGNFEYIDSIDQPIENSEDMQQNYNEIEDKEVKPIIIEHETTPEDIKENHVIEKQAEIKDIQGKIDDNAKEEKIDTEEFDFFN